MSATQQQTQKNCQFYVAVEIDSYNTFYPYAQTSKQFMQQHETVEYKGEVWKMISREKIIDLIEICGLM